MDKKIDIETHGDYWENREHALKKLYGCSPSDVIAIDFLYQGTCPFFSGVMHELDKFCYLTKTPPQNIKIIHPCVFLDVSPYKLADIGNVPYELLTCGQYWVNNISFTGIKEKKFGYFVGRPSTPRIKFFYDIYKNDIEDQFFLSRMENSGNPHWLDDNAYLDSLDYWIKHPTVQEDFLYWYENHHNVKSFDNLTIDDQYSPSAMARNNLVNKYYYYDIDIVFETSTVGKTFEITEKTIRSFITKKPFIVYSSPDFIKRVKEMGFKTFDGFWSEDYDHYCLKERYEKILKIVNDISNMPENDYSDMISGMQEICEYNKNHLRNLAIGFHGSEENWINNSKKTGIT